MLLSSNQILFHDDSTQNRLYVTNLNTDKFTLSIISKATYKEAVKRNNSMTVMKLKWHIF